MAFEKLLAKVEMPDIDGDPDMPGWQLALRVLGMLAGLLLLAALVMGLILLVAKFFDTQEQRPSAPLFIDITSTPASRADERARTPLTSGLIEWPHHPGQSIPISLTGGSKARAQGDARAAAAAPRAAPVPVGLSADEYRETLGSGRKVYLPDPQGECDLGGQGSANLIGALENCFAPRAARS